MVCEEAFGSALDAAVLTFTGLGVAGVSADFFNCLRDLSETQRETPLAVAVWNG